tara:strand:- start:22511 stop:22684 length:174 start_codon:yes stop_codon:yes gene_type:complete
MFFKGNSKAFRIDFIEVMMFSIDMNNWDFISIKPFKFLIAIDIDDFNRKLKLLAHTF